MNQNQLTPGSFTPRSNIEEYIAEKNGVMLYEAFYETVSWVETHKAVKINYNALEYFNLLYEKFALILANKDKPLATRNHLLELGIEDWLRYILLCQLHDLTDDYSEELKIVREFLDIDADNLECKFYSHVDPVKSKPSNPAVELNNLLTEGLNESVQIQSPGQYSNSQLVLIFFYFFKFNRLEIRRDVDIAPIAKFIHLITGKDFTTTANSDFYTKLRKAPNFKGDKGLMRDLQAIKPLFEAVQLNEVAKMIQNEIEIAFNERSQD